MCTRASFIADRGFPSAATFPSFRYDGDIAMESVLAQFDGLKLREVSFDRDVLTLACWISEDPAHQLLRPAYFLGQIEGPDGYLTPDPRPTCYALEDEHGTVFYIRLDRAARVNIQFDPTLKKLSDRVRVARGLLKGMAFLEVGLARVNVSQWIFDTRAAGLAAMAQARLGFMPSPHELVRLIPRLSNEDDPGGAPTGQEPVSREVM
jgi:hypothetical protein